MTASTIAALMSEMLEIDDMALDDNFFEVGGNSMLALQLMTKLEQQSGAKVSLLDVVRAPTPNLLAPVIAARSRTESTVN